MAHRDLEGKAYRSQFGGGLLEFFVGIALVAIGLGWIFGQLAISCVVPAALTMLWPGVRSRVIVPRTGWARFNSARRRRESRGSAILVVLGIAIFCFAMVLPLVFRSWLGLESVIARDLVRGLPAFLLVLGTLLAATIFGIHRLFYHAFLFLLAAGLTIILRIDPGWSILAAGVILLLAGIFLLVGFSRRNPRVAEYE